MSGCEGCFTSARGIDEQRSILRTQAKVLAVEKSKAIAIVQEGPDMHLMELSIAIENKYSIIEIVSHV